MLTGNALRSTGSATRRSAQRLQASAPAARRAFSSSQVQRRGSSAIVHSADNPVRQVLSGVVSTIYKVSALTQAPEAGLSPLWQAIKRLDGAGVASAAKSGANLNERDDNGDTPLIYIARQGHYKYTPADIPTTIVAAGADLEAKDKSGLTALEISLLSGWQNIAYLLLNNGAKTTGVAAIKGRITCPDCKRVVAQYNL